MAEGVVWFYISFNSVGELPFAVSGHKLFEPQTQRSMFSYRKLLWLLPLFFLAACDSADITPVHDAIAASEPAVQEATDTNIVDEQPGDLVSGNRKVIRKTDLYCRVQDVSAAVNGMEQLVAAMGGTVEQSRVDNNIIQDKMVAYKSDSLKHVQVFATTATMRLRVPAYLSDTLAQMIQSRSGFLERKSSSQEDVTLKLLSNQLMNKHGKGKANGANVHDGLEEKKEAEIRRYIDNLKMIDDVQYATLSVTLTQPDLPVVQIVPDIDGMMKESYATRLRIAMSGGLDLIIGLVLGLLSIWPLLLIALVITYLVRRNRKRRMAAFQGGGNGVV